MRKELTLSQIQEGSRKVLSELKTICNKIGVKFYLAYGTLIGAVRHEGFIPWDDDIDVWMPRADYEEFVRYCRENAEEIKPFELKHYSIDQRYIYPIARLSDTRYIIDYTNAKDYGLGLFVDIYPLDGYAEDKRFYKKLKRTIRLVSFCGEVKYSGHKNFVKKVLGYLYFIYSRMVNLNKLLGKLDKLAQKYSFEKTNEFSCNVWDLGYHYCKADIQNTLYMNFGDEAFPAPAGYDNVLKVVYGDYMQLPPEEERIAHHYYTAYKKD